MKYTDKACIGTFQMIAHPFGTKKGIWVMVPALMVVSIALSCLVNPSYNFVYRILSAEANAATVIFVTSDTYGSERMGTSGCIRVVGLGLRLGLEGKKSDERGLR